MKVTRLMVPAILLLPVMVGACTTYGPPPPGYPGESWRRHVHRCLRAYPRYDPRTDMIERPDGPVRCTL